MYRGQPVFKDSRGVVFVRIPQKLKTRQKVLRDNKVEKRKLGRAFLEELAQAEDTYITSASQHAHMLA